MSNCSTTIPFSGFYESLHDNNLDFTLERSVDFEGTGSPDPELWDTVRDGVDWHQAHEAYAKLYAERFNDMAAEVLGWNPELTFESLSSPKFYNFETDRIFCHIPPASVMRLRLEVDAELFAQAIKARFTSYDGFISHYSNDVADWHAKPVSTWDHNEVGTLLVAAIESAAQRADGVLPYQARYSRKGDPESACAFIQEEITQTLAEDSNGELTGILDAALSPEALAAINAAYETYSKAEEVTHA